MQESNKSTNFYVTHNGETKTVSEWARIYNIHRCVLVKRLRRGWNLTVRLPQLQENIVSKKLIERV